MDSYCVGSWSGRLTIQCGDGGAEKGTALVKRKCDKCDKAATHHSVEIINGEKIEKHLCDQHAAEEGISIKTVQAPINELLSNFVKLQGGQPEEVDQGDESVTGPTADASEMEVKAGFACPECGLTFAQFREKSLLGCPECYKAFERQLCSLLERAHEGGVHHIGKVPVRAGADENRQSQLMRMRKRLDEAVNSEDYELAARLRDDIRTFEESAE
ncbi:UvrB/uvrC motif protein [Poriferisphaera corsica]|uniref:UvrB/uvrC motif protein n=1 Tax=Poriferisphaera corsica TaxID=2528020 RepID=A0A517YTT5_9BACT|nr:UvrB/UvrC motif-containing protein [Poriferisphaera corsica]QDU33645.1 UvrB/uvrC motif protein [Poriferisphaera corsica]